MKTCSLYFGALLLILSISTNKLVAQNQKNSSDTEKISSKVEVEVESELATTTKTETVDLKVLSWNVQLLPAMYWPLSWRFRSWQYKRINWISDYLNEQDFDVIALQEIFTKKMARKMRRKLHKQYPHQIRPKNKRFTLRLSDGVLVVSKLPIEQIDYVFFDDGYSHDKMANKGCVLIQGEKEGVPFQLTATHLQSINDSSANAVRQSQCQQIKNALLDPHQQSNVPQLITGDLNVRKSIEDWYETVLGILDAEDYDLNDPRPYTFDNQNYWVQKHPKAHDNVQLDYILLRKNGSQTNIKQLTLQRPTKQYKDQTVDYADHYGVIAEIELKR